MSVLKQWDGATWAPVGSAGESLADSTATLDELVAASYLDASVAVAISFPVLTAPFALRVAQVSLVSLAAVAASDANFWTVELRHYTAAGGGPTVIASKTTKVTGGVAMTSAADWNFDAITFANASLVKGDTFTVAFIPTGAPTALDRPALTFRYVPL